MLRTARREIVEPSVAYDRYAERYDGLLVENRINAYMRERMLTAHRATFRPEMRLLEIGCGTGDEALELARSGCEIVAVDPSGEMLNRARAKAARGVGPGRVTFVQGHARAIGGLLSTEPDGSFDGAYSSFAMSYEPDLQPVKEALARLIRSDGWLVVALMNRVCAAEWLIAASTMHPSVAGRRLSRNMPHKVGTVATEIFGRTVSEIDSVFEDAFRRVDVRAVPAVIPPAYANRAFRRLPSLLEMLGRIDPGVSGLPLVRTLGDHTMLRYRRRP